MERIEREQQRFEAMTTAANTSLEKLRTMAKSEDANELTLAHHAKAYLSILERKETISDRLNLLTKDVEQERKELYDERVQLIHDIGTQATELGYAIINDVEDDKTTIYRALETMGKELKKITSTLAELDEFV